MSGSVNPIKKENNEKSKVRPQNMSEKIELWPPHKKIKKKRGKGQNMSEKIDLVIMIIG